MIAAQAVLETKMLLRNGEQLLLTVVIPTLLLVLFSSVDIVDTGAGKSVDFLTPGILALAVMSTAFTGQAIATGFERRYGVIKRLGASPLPRSGLLMGKIGGLLVVEVMQVVVIAAVGIALGWRPSTSPAALLGALLALFLGTFAFAALGLFLAGALRAEATLAAANLVYLLLMAGGAVVLPADAYGAAGHALSWLPSGALGEAMRAALTHADIAVTDLAVLALWGAVGTVLTAKTFTWE
jgi:ABC-2 type transport system permease protein